MPADVVGALQVFVAFDWGEEIRLGDARALVSGSDQELPRRPRTPASFSFRPSPLHVSLGEKCLPLPILGDVKGHVAVTIFDFGAVSVSIRLPLQASREKLLELAGALADSALFVRSAAEAVTPVFDRIRSAVDSPEWNSAFFEDYYVFHLPPDELTRLGDPAFLAGLVHLEEGPLCDQELAEATRLRLAYGTNDLFVPDWAAAVLVDEAGEDTLQAIEFANLQLLEYRHIDERLDKSLIAASRTIRPLARRYLPFWRAHSRPIRLLGELKVEAADLFERTGNALKLVGEPYLARAYRLLASRFHLETWEQAVRRKLETAENVYQVLTDQARDVRAEFLEIVVIFLILIEVVIAVFFH